MEQYLHIGAGVEQYLHIGAGVDHHLQCISIRDWCGTVSMCIPSLYTQPMLSYLFAYFSKRYKLSRLVFYHVSEVYISFRSI